MIPYSPAYDPRSSGYYYWSHQDTSHADPDAEPRGPYVPETYIYVDCPTCDKPNREVRRDLCADCAAEAWVRAIWGGEPFGAVAA